MIPTFVISLPDCDDRRNIIADQLGRLKIAFEFVDAVDGRDGLDPAYENQIDRVGARRSGLYPMSDVEFACALSHVKCYHRIVADNVSHALILEDDVILNPDLGQFLAGKHYRDAAVTQLYIRRPYVRRGGEPLFGGYVSYLRAPRIERAGAAAYVMSLDAARYFAEHATPINRAADWPACAEDLISRRDWRIVHPTLVSHPPPQEGQSLIDACGRLEAAREGKLLEGYHRRKLWNTYGSLLRKIFFRRLPNHNNRAYSETPVR